MKHNHEPHTNTYNKPHTNTNGKQHTDMGDMATTLQTYMEHRYYPRYSPQTTLPILEPLDWWACLKIQQC